MENSMLWIAGGIALALVVTALVVAALFWVRRPRADTREAEQPHHYEAPAVIQPGTGGRSSVLFGSNEAVDDVAVDQTVPRSRLGGAGWRDGGAAVVETTTDAYAASSGTWAAAGSEPDSHDVRDPVSGPHVTVDDPDERSDERSLARGEADERRGGHW